MVITVGHDYKHRELRWSRGRWSSVTPQPWLNRSRLHNTDAPPPLILSIVRGTVPPPGRTVKAAVAPRSPPARPPTGVPLHQPLYAHPPIQCRPLVTTTDTNITPADVAYPTTPTTTTTTTTTSTPYPFHRHHHQLLHITIVIRPYIN